MGMINEKKASELIGVCPATLRSWRLKNLFSKLIKYLCLQIHLCTDIFCIRLKSCI